MRRVAAAWRAPSQLAPLVGCDAGACQGGALRPHGLGLPAGTLTSVCLTRGSRSRRLCSKQTILPEAASLYKHQDLSLKQGETIR